MIRLACKQQSAVWSQMKDEPTLLSATDVVSVVGMNDYLSRRKLFGIRTGTATKPDLTGNPAVQRGRELEPEAIGWALPRLGLAPNRWLPFQPGSVVAWDPDVPLTCSPDVLMVTADGSGLCGLEVKVPFLSPPAPVPRPGHVVQVMASLLVTGADRWWLCYYWQADPSLSELFVIRPNQEAFGVLRRAAVEFLNEVDDRDTDAGLRSVKTTEKDQLKTLFMKTVKRLIVR